MQPSWLSPSRFKEHAIPKRPVKSGSRPSGRDIRLPPTSVTTQSQSSCWPICRSLKSSTQDRTQGNPIASGSTGHRRTVPAFKSPTLRTATYVCARASSGGAAGSIANSGDGAYEQLDLRECRHFVNLTNGLEALPMLHELQLPYSFVRIQSTACEQQNLEALMAELDANLLVNLALGHCCLVYDCGSRGRDGTPRALWYGLEFVRYTLSKLWLRQPCTALLRGKNVARQFDQHIRSFRQSTTRRLQYYTKYLPQGTGTGLEDATGASSGAGADLHHLRLYGVFRPTDHDHDGAHFVRLLHQHDLPPRFAGASGQQQQQQQQQRDAEHKREVQVRADSCAAAEYDASTRQPELSGKERGLRSVSPGSGSRFGPGQACGGDYDAQQDTVRRSSSGADTGPCGAVEVCRVREAVLVSKVAASQDPSQPVLEEDAGHVRWPLERVQRSGPSDGMVGRSEMPLRKGMDALLATSVANDADGEAVLARFGFSLFRRGLSPVEWAAKAAETAVESAGSAILADEV